MKSRWILAALVVVVGSAVYVGNVLATPPSSTVTSSTVASSTVTTTILGKSLFNEIDVHAHSIPDRLWRARIDTRGMSDVYVVDNKLAPGATTGWHSHPGPSLILVVAGTVTNYLADDPGCTGHAYTAGTGFIDRGGADVHMLRNNGPIQAETIAVQLLPHGADRKIEAPDPGTCRF